MEAVIEHSQFPAYFISFCRHDHDIARFKGRGEGAAKALGWMPVYFDIFPNFSIYLPKFNQLNGRMAE